jgi:hypothetical protein
MKIQSFPTVVDLTCDRVRLAEGDVAAVDRCGCGMIQVHVAALTLRLAPEALASLLGTLGQAVAANAASPLRRSNALGATEQNADRWSES